MIAKKGKMNPFLLMKFIEASIILINPICPHFAEYCWATHVLPVLEKSQNLKKQPAKHLINQGWPTPSGSFNKLYRRMYDYLKRVKSTVNLSLEKAKLGGKKAKGGKAAQKAEVKVAENCLIFTAL